MKSNYSTAPNYHSTLVSKNLLINEKLSRIINKSYAVIMKRELRHNLVPEGGYLPHKLVTYYLNNCWELGM
jgi:hypothetical protein